MWNKDEQQRLTDKANAERARQDEARTSGEELLAYIENEASHHNRHGLAALHDLITAATPDQEK